MKPINLLLMLMLTPAARIGQAPPAPQTAAGSAAGAAAAGLKVAVVDFQRAVTENADGKKAASQLMAEVTSRQTKFDQTQKSLEDMQTQLRTQERSLSEAARA